MNLCFKVFLTAIIRNRYINTVVECTNEQYIYLIVR